MGQSCSSDYLIRIELRFEAGPPKIHGQDHQWTITSSRASGLPLLPCRPESSPKSLVAYGPIRSVHLLSDSTV
jgi:hypothetical protein